jgi:hypothetical protein
MEFRGAQEARALAIVSARAGEFLRQYEATPDKADASHSLPEFAAAQATLATARAAEDAARRQLDVLVKEHFNTLRSVNQPSPTAVAPRPAPVQHAPPRVGRLEREQAQAELERLQRQRTSLLAQLTTEHPRVKLLDDEIAAARQRLEGLAESMDESALEVAPPPIEPLPNGELLETVRTLAASQHRFRAALDEYELARTRRLEAEAVVEVLAQPSAKTAAAPARFWLAQPPQIVDRVPVFAPAARLSLMGLAAAIVGLLTFVGLRPRPARAAEFTAADLETALGLPVIARLPVPKRGAA